ncbi:hypothetical protein BC827DRAFT_1165489 [Russula dissimulans]|nr:hypothetical protein BC827DRAFT_1165489 [Russula dissimulans]
MSGDEFDRLPDPFAGVNWNNVPGLSANPLPSHPGPSTSRGTLALVAPRHSVTPGANSTSASMQYSFDEIDAAFLAEVDKVERRLLRPQFDSQGDVTSRYFHGGDTLYAFCYCTSYILVVTNGRAEEDPPHERVASMQSHAEGSGNDALQIPEPGDKSAKVVHALSSPSTPESGPKRHKGKQKESHTVILKEFLDSFEDEMICPICCDIFAFAHLGNPCGHTFCGECGWSWIKKNKQAPSCPICRASLSEGAPLIPNFAVDSAVEKHVQALRTNGVEGWENSGAKLTEWQARKARWKENSTKLTARKSMTTNFSVVVAPYALAPSSSNYVGEEAGSSSSRSRNSDMRREPTRRRAQANQHHDHQHHRRSGGRGGMRRSRRRRRERE